MVKSLPAMRETQVRSLGWEDPLKKGLTSHSSILGRIPWTKEPGGLYSTGSQRVEHDWVLNTHTHTHTHTHISDTTSDAEKNQLWYHVSLSSFAAWSGRWNLNLLNWASSREAGLSGKPLPCLWTAAVLHGWVQPGSHQAVLSLRT